MNEGNHPRDRDNSRAPQIDHFLVASRRRPQNVHLGVASLGTRTPSPSPQSTAGLPLPPFSFADHSRGLHDGDGAETEGRREGRLSGVGRRARSLFHARARAFRSSSSRRRESEMRGAASTVGGESRRLREGSGEGEGEVSLLVPPNQRVAAAERTFGQVFR